jgi:phospho-N-acetylmuramoyl-pentapeptide-transferase
MFYWLYTTFGQDISGLNVLRYISFRSIWALITALAFTMALGKPFIAWLRHQQKHGQPIRSDGPESHLLTKKSTPTMGGMMILLTLTVSTLLWGDWGNVYILSILLVTLGYGAIGFYDDFLKLRYRNSKGLSGKGKLFWQSTLAATALAILYLFTDPMTFSTLSLPFFKDILWDLGWFFVPFAVIVLVGTSNAVNLTDGLDGLATVPIMVAVGCYGIIAYLTGHAIFADYLYIKPIVGTGELSVFCAALIGSCLGFLWFNAPPASVFMGDTGSLGLGGALGALSVMTKQELLLLVIGGVFVVEAASVILQVGSYKLRKKRIFKMAPLHHHFEKNGLSESTIVIRFWIVAVILALVGLASLKVR